MTISKADLVALLAPRKMIGISALQGGDISSVWRVTLDTRESIIVKVSAAPEIEARMLHALSANGAATPDVILAAGRLLVLSDVPSASASESGWRRLGEMLRQMHSVKQDARYGWRDDYGIGSIVLPKAQSYDWSDYWLRDKLQPLARYLPALFQARFKEMAGEMTGHLPKYPSPALLHGDLWLGNVLFSDHGVGALIDPACMIGDAHAEFAILTLFSTPPSVFWQAYGGDVTVLQPKFSIYQLWPALVHYRLFGDSYLGLIEKIMDEIARHIAAAS